MESGIWKSPRGPPCAGTTRIRFKGSVARATLSALARSPGSLMLALRWPSASGPHVWRGGESKRGLRSYPDQCLMGRLTLHFQSPSCGTRVSASPIQIPWSLFCLLLGWALGEGEVGRTTRVWTPKTLGKLGIRHHGGNVALAVNTDGCPAGNRLFAVRTRPGLFDLRLMGRRRAISPESPPFTARTIRAHFFALLCRLEYQCILDPAARVTRNPFISSLRQQYGFGMVYNSALDKDPPPNVPWSSLIAVHAPIP